MMKTKNKSVVININSAIDNNNRAIISYNDMVSIVIGGDDRIGNSGSGTDMIMVVCVGSLLRHTHTQRGWEGFTEILGSDDVVPACCIVRCTVADKLTPDCQLINMDDTYPKQT